MQYFVRSAVGRGAVDDAQRPAAPVDDQTAGATLGQSRRPRGDAPRPSPHPPTVRLPAKAAAEEKVELSMLNCEGRIIGLCCYRAGGWSNGTSGGRAIWK